jgi:ATP-dependent protease HslVU (ClpYQ) peptidase subunit
MTTIIAYRYPEHGTIVYYDSLVARGTAKDDGFVGEKGIKVKDIWLFSSGSTILNALVNGHLEEFESIIENPHKVGLKIALLLDAYKRQTDDVSVIWVSEDEVYSIIAGHVDKIADHKCFGIGSGHDYATSFFDGIMSYELNSLSNVSKAMERAVKYAKKKDTHTGGTVRRVFVPIKNEKTGK